MKQLNPVTFNGRLPRNPEEVFQKKFSGSPMAGQQGPQEPVQEPEPEDDTDLAPKASEGQEGPPGPAESDLATAAVPKRAAGD